MGVEGDQTNLLHKGKRIQETPIPVSNPTLSRTHSHNQHGELTALLILCEEQVHALRDYQPKFH